MSSLTTRAGSATGQTFAQRLWMGGWLLRAQQPASLSRKYALPWKSCDVPVSKGQCHCLPQCLPGLCALSCLSSPAPIFKNCPHPQPANLENTHFFFFISKILHSHLPLSLFISPHVSDFTLKPASDWSCQPVFSVACPATWWLAGSLSLMLHTHKKS